MEDFVVRKILLLVIGIILISPISVFAEISNGMAGEMVFTKSMYSVKYQVGDKDLSHDCTMQVYMQKFSLAKEPEVLIFANSNSTDDKNALLIFSMKNPPILQIVKNNVNEDFPLIKKFSGVDSVYIVGSVDRNAVQQAASADAVYIVFPTNEGGKKKFEIPQDIVSEWQVVINSDMKKIRKELTGK